MHQSLLDRSYAALLAGARKVSPSVRYDKNSYAPRWQDNLMNGLPLREITSDLSTGAGRELDGKLCAARSSAALVVNTFGPCRIDAASLLISGITGFHSLQFEATCPTGLGGTPPHLDLLAEGKLPVAVESKCTEWMQSKLATFSSSYDQLQTSQGHSPWFHQMQHLRREPNLYQFLDAAQIVKHAFGLLKRYGTLDSRLVYLYWEPRNEENWPPCRQHRREADDLAAKVERSNVRLIPMSHRELWAEWGRQGPSDHEKYLRTRYDLAV
jgi:hypothetical protein